MSRFWPLAAREALRQHRFTLKVAGRPVKLAYAVEGRDGRDKIFGPAGLRFFIVVKVRFSSVISWRRTRCRTVC